MMHPSLVSDFLVNNSIVLCYIFFNVDHFPTPIEFATVLLVFFFFFCKGYEILAPQSGIKPTPPALEGKVLTTEPPGKSQVWWFSF